MAPELQSSESSWSTGVVTATTCSQCDPGKYSAGSTACVAAGYACASTGTSNSVLPCVVGKFSTAGDMACHDCPTGSKTYALEGAGRGRRVHCDSATPCGADVASVGGVGCSTCAVDTGVCSACSAGYGYSSGSHKCTRCDAGSASDGSVACAVSCISFCQTRWTHKVVRKTQRDATRAK